MSSEDASAPIDSGNVRRLTVFGYAGGAGLLAAAGWYGTLYTLLRIRAGWDPPYESTGGLGVLLYLAMIAGSPLVGFLVYERLLPRVEAAVQQRSALGVVLGSTVGLIVAAFVGLVALAVVAMYVIAAVFYYVFGLLVVAAIVGKASR